VYSKGKDSSSYFRDNKQVLNTLKQDKAACSDTGISTWHAIYLLVSVLFMNSFIRIAANPFAEFFKEFVTSLRYKKYATDPCHYDEFYSRENITSPLKVAGTNSV
jgi:hypothetical protein